MTAHVHIDEFQPVYEDIEAYLERVDLYFLAGGTKEANKVPLFLTVVDKKNYTLLRDMVAPVKSRKKNLATLYEKLRKHYQPKKVVITERFHFYRQNQSETNNIAEYLAELRHLTTHCEFGEGLTDALRYRLVCGLRNVAARTKLLAEDKLTLETTIELASVLETAESQMKQLRMNTEITVHQIKSTIPTNKAIPDYKCYRCSSNAHMGQFCSNKESICRNCHKRGHLARACRSQSMTSYQGNAKNYSTRCKNKPSNYLEVSTDEEGKDVKLPIYHMGGPNTTPIVVVVQFNGKHLKMEVDTGAAISVIPKCTCTYEDCSQIWR